MDEKCDGYSRSRSVPCQSQQDGSVAAIVVVIVLLQPLRDHVVHLLVVLEAGCEEGGLGFLAEQLWLLRIQSVDTSSCEQSASPPDQTRRVALIFVRTVLWVGGIAALPLLAEGGL